ncbi:hypothetical protein DICA3_F25972 [Diutina catenulata]
MKLNVASATVILAAISQVAAAPAFEQVSADVSKREFDIVSNAIANIEHYNTKRSDMTLFEREAQESKIVTDVLTAIKNTQLAAPILKWIVNDPQVGPAASNLIVTLIKNKTIDLTTLLTGLADSGLAVDVVKYLINDCEFYETIYKIVLNFISDLPNQIASLLGGGKRDLSLETDLQVAPSSHLVMRDSTQDLVTSLMMSLKNSGLANQVVGELVKDEGFRTWGVQLIKDLFSSGALTLPDLLDAVIKSGLVPALIEGLLSFDTIKDVIVNALAAAFGKCDGETLTSLSASKTETATIPQPSSTGTTPKPTGTNPNCKKRRRSYNYNY